MILYHVVRIGLDPSEGPSLNSKNDRQKIGWIDQYKIQAPSMFADFKPINAGFHIFIQLLAANWILRAVQSSNMFQPSSPTSPAVPGTSCPQLASAPATPRRRAASAGSATRGRGLPGVAQALRPSAPTAAGSDCCRTSAPRLLRGRKWSWGGQRKPMAFVVP